LGTLSFGTKSRKSFTEEEISMMKMVADLVAIATDRLKNVQALQESEKQATQRAEELQKMMNIVPSAIWIAQDPECLQITGNDTANRFYEAREGENVSAGVDPSIRRFFRNGVELSAKELTMQVAASSGTEIRNSELEVLLPSGRWMTMLGNASPLKDENGKVRGCVGAFMDITDRKEAEKENQLMIQLLQISNESQNVKEFIHSSLEFFRSLANFDAVGLRLKKGIDYPYYETIGFSQDFIRTEKYLCAHDKKGDILLDAHCHPQYECLCGQVISRKVENETFSTEFGSIWSNDSSSLNIRELEQQLQRKIRGRCIREGYQSISLIPLKLRNENIGLLQLNDRRKGLINSDKIALIERLSGPFSIALARFLAEEEVQNKEENLRQHAEMLEHAPVLVRTMQGEITVWNSGMEKLYGYNRAEALGQNEEQLLRTQFPKPLSEIMDEMLQKNFWEGELVHSCKDGSIVEVHSLWTLHHDQQGNPVAIIEVNNDITNRKKKEQELHRANRVLNALGKSSQTMMHSQNEMQFINEVCKILVEDCGHSLVWIGYAQDNKAKTVLPVAHSGFDEGYLANLRVSWADDEYGRGPTGMAIKTGKACLSRNITTDPCFEPWRKDAQQRGYNSSIALPLHSNGKVFGVLALYSKDVSSFSPDEVDLLTRLSEDLSFGINTIRLRESENTAIALLTQSEQKYRTLFNEMAEGFTYHQLIQDEMGNTRDYLFLDVNPAFEKHTGMSAEQVIGKKASEIYPDMNIYWIGIYEDVSLHGVNREFEVYNPSLNRFFRVSAFSTQKGYFATIFENITDRVLSQKELQSTKNYLESLINYANAPIIVWNDKMEIKLFNRAFEHLTGYGADEVLGKPLDMLFPVAYAGEIKLKIQQTKYENWESIEIPILTKGKETRTILWNSANIYDPDSNHLISVIAQGNDITERKKAERQLKEAQEKLILALDNGKIGTWEMDPRSSYLVWDKRMEQMFGFAAGTFDGRYETFENCLVEEDRTEVRDAIWRAVGESKPYETVLRIRNPYGDINYINAKALVIHDSEGKPVRMSGVCFDITDMKKGAERILFKLNEDLHRSNKELEQFAYVASHDLQEPLRMVSSFTQLLAQRYKDKLDQDGKEFIHYAVDGAVRMQRLINDLLNYSRIGTRGQKFNWVNFQDVMQKTLSNLKIRIEEKNASIFYDGLPSVKGDDIQLIQLMQNLIGNALKFCKAEPVIQISAIESDNYYQFSVKDNGIGIEPQYFDKIFLIFQRLLPKDRYEGTGIGLAICKRIVERHGGKIWVESTPGEGTTFYFTLIKN
jgi:PAS domain S-box-containing protein